MKKLLVIILATLVILTLIVGCSKKETTALLAVSTTATTLTVAPPPASSAPPPVSTVAPPPPTTITTTPAQTIMARGTTEMTQPDVNDSMTLENGKLVIVGTHRIASHGTMEGKIISRYTMKIDMKNGKVDLKSEGTFTGTVDGKKGTFTSRESGAGQMLGPDSGMLSSSINIVSGTGELTGLNGSFSNTGSWDATKSIGNYAGPLNLAAVPPVPTPPPPPGFEVSGTAGQTRLIVESEKSENGKLTFEATFYNTYHGTMEGEAVIKSKWQTDNTTGTRTGTAEVTFTGTIDGKQGTFIATGVEKSQFLSRISGTLMYKFTIASGSGALSKLLGTYSVSGTITTGEGAASDTFSGNYLGWLNFEN